MKLGNSIAACARQRICHSVTSEGVVSTRVGPLLMAIGSICMRLIDQSGTAEILAVFALAALTMSLQREPFQLAVRTVSRSDPPAGSSVPAR